MSLMHDSQLEFPGSLEPGYRTALESLVRDRAVERLRERDVSLWLNRSGASAASRLGWLDAPRWLQARIPELKAFATEIREAGITRVLLLGMGGSSLTAEVLRESCIAGPGAPRLDVLDSTDPDSIAAAESSAAADRTLFLVSSRSGRSIETLSLYRHFRSRVEALDLDHPGHRFVAITDEGSPLDRLAVKEGFVRIFRNPSGVGGRFSALTYFGMIPAALLGLDLRALAARAVAAREDSLSAEPHGRVLRLAAMLGAAVRAGRDKLTLLTTPSTRALGGWIEQLVAESTGKDSTGLIPVEGEPLGPSHHYGADRAFLSISLASEETPEMMRLETDARSAGSPWIRILLEDRDEVAGEFYRWEVAATLLAVAIGVDPFDEPDIDESKTGAHALLAAWSALGGPPAEAPRGRDDGIEIHASDEVWALLAKGAPSLPSLEGVLSRFLALAREGDYVSILAYLDRTAASEASFELLRRAVRNAIHVPVLQSYGPRYLHSIGQLYKGGPPRGLFLMITVSHPSDIPVPGSSYSFERLEWAEAHVDFEALTSRKRPILRLHLTQGIETGLSRIARSVERALAAIQSA